MSKTDCGMQDVGSCPQQYLENSKANVLEAIAILFILSENTRLQLIAS